MAKCVKLQRTKTQVCTGNLDKLIEIYQRDIEPPLNSFIADPDYTETFTLLYTVWSMIQTPKGKVIFDDIGTEKRITNVFYTRYLPDITSQNWIVYNGKRYDIERVKNLEENNLYLEIATIIRGDDTKAASEA